jgi:chromosomal replication initiator protein
VQEELREKLRREQFETWFRRTALAHLDEERFVVAVHNGFTRDWMSSYYMEVLDQAVLAVLGSRRRIELQIDPERTAPPRAPQPAAREPALRGSGAAVRDAGPAREGPRNTRLGAGVLLDSSDVALNPSYRFDSFVVGPCNRFAHAACFGVSENPGKTYNPLFLHGSVGLGKTHLLQSLCHALLERQVDARILYLSCETFVNHFISALENGDLEKFRTKYRNVDLLVVDDIHLLANKERTQEEFFHTFNTLYNAGKQIVLSSDSPPVEIPTLQERLVSRFKWGLVTEVVTPCYETRMAILKRKSKERGRELPDDVARILAERIESNIRELEGAVTKVLGYAAVAGQPITPELVRQCLKDLFAVRAGQPAIEDVLRVVTERFAVKLSDLQSKKRTSAIAYPRQVGMYLARKITRMSLEEIGGYFGGRDHTTVLYAVQKLEALSRVDPVVHELLSSLSFELRGPSGGA